MYKTYKALTYISAPLLRAILKKRCKAGKELPARVQEKMAITEKLRPSGKLIWLHAASVGEAQSTLILIDNFLKIDSNLNILVTTGTLTSAEIMAAKLPKQAFHQFYPLDHPKWVAKFIAHWNPDAVIWMESELWPNMLHEIGKRKIPALLVNAHMSEKSFKSWQRVKSFAKTTLSTFTKILCQTDIDKIRFSELGARNIIVTDNLKYSAATLDYNNHDLDALSQNIGQRPIWLYASTHKGEEEIACAVHIALKKQFPELLTIIVPRHPQRRNEIKDTCEKFALNIEFRGSDKKLPKENSDIYIADTLGELGVFYRLSPLACIGRTLSDDGGGGHNPIEAAQLGCAVLHGANVANLQDIFDEMDNAKAAICLNNQQELETELISLLADNEKIIELQNAGKQYSDSKIHVIEKVMAEIRAVLGKENILNAD